MATAAQIRANRHNAQASTGPQTDQGKSVASRNAVSHGLFCDQYALPGEDVAEFQAFAEAVVADLRPVGMNQILLAKRIAQIQWKLERIPKIEAWVMADLASARRMHSTYAAGDIIAGDLETFLRYQLYEQRLERSYRAYMKEFRQLKKEAEEEPSAEAEEAMMRYLPFVWKRAEEIRALDAARDDVDSKKQTQFDANDRPDKDLSGLEDIKVALEREAAECEALDRAQREREKGAAA